MVLSSLDGMGGGGCASERGDPCIAGLGTSVMCDTKSGWELRLIFSRVGGWVRVKAMG